MSTFGGKIKEIPYISIDRFDGENLFSDAYLLSHCHTDHMKGLIKSPNFYHKITKHNNFLYASPVSCAILRKMFPLIKSQIKELSLNSATSIFVKDQSISIHPIPAGHCPGSVMFLIETTDKRILYTGDYRINPSDLKRFKHFYDSLGNMKIIEALYLDTTFFLTSYPKFPTRQESVEELCNVIRSWISQNDKNIVHLLTSARYGYEYIFMELFKAFNMPVHISQDSYDLYSLVPELDKAVTTDGSVTNIHCSYGKISLDPGKPLKDTNVKIIKLSAFRWNENSLNEGLSSCNSQNDITYVCYSTHASYEEGVTLIEFLKPKVIVPCVEHEEPDQKMRMLKLIDEKLNEVNSRRNIQNDDIQLFDIKAQKGQESDDDSSDLISSQESAKSKCDMFDSPPRKKILTFFKTSLLDSPPR